MADDTSGTGYRLSAPSYQMYDTVAGEQGAMRGISPDTMAALYPFILNQRTRAANDQMAYGRQLDTVNRQQGQLASARLSHDELVNLRATGVKLAEQGADLSNIGAFNTMFNNRGMTAQTDLLRRDAKASESLQRRGAGVESLSAAGIQVNPGQNVPNTDSDTLNNLQFSTHRPVAIEKAQIDATGTVTAAGLRAASEDGVRTKITGPAGSPSAQVVETTGRNPAAVQNQFNTVTAAQRAALTAGNAGTPTGGSRALSREDAVAKARSMGLPPNTSLTQVERTGQWQANVPGRSPINIQ